MKLFIKFDILNHQPPNLVHLKLFDKSLKINLLTSIMYLLEIESISNRIKMICSDSFNTLIIAVIKAINRNTYY